MPPHPWFRLRQWAPPLLLAGLIALPGLLPRAEAAPEPGGTQATAPVPPEADPAYLQVLKAYRSQLSREELDSLEANVDPSPALYLEAASGPQRGVIRLFASLPDEAHAELRRTGYLKWRADSLPPEQRRWLKEMVRQLESQGEGPFPLEGKEAGVLSMVGFARVEMEGLELPQYSWWIAAPRARRPAWVTVVRAVGLLLQAHFTAHREQLATLQAQPDSSPVPAARWQKVRELQRPAPVAPPVLVPEKGYREALRAYRGELQGEALQSLSKADPLVARRLRLTDPADRDLNRLFARLTEKEHQELLTTGRLVWFPRDLSRERAKLLEPVFERLNRQARESGETRDPYSLAPRFPVACGFAVVQVPGVETPTVCWWVRSSVALHPAWVTLVNGAAVETRGYYRAHLEALSE